MKNLPTLSIMLILGNNLLAQTSNWMDSTLSKILLAEIEVFDKNFKRIENHMVRLNLIDTVVNDWTGNVHKSVSFTFIGSFWRALRDSCYLA
jgi:hypothetical protein